VDHAFKRAPNRTSIKIFRDVLRQKIDEGMFHYIFVYSFYRLFILKSEVLDPSEGRQIGVRSNFLDVLGSSDALITKEKISGFLICIYIYIIKILSTLLL